MASTRERRNPEHQDWRHHWAAPESWDIGDEYAYHSSWLCPGRLQAAYVRAGTAARWTRVGTICVACGTFWRDSAALTVVEPDQRRASDLVRVRIGTVDSVVDEAVDGSQENGAGVRA